MYRGCADDFQNHVQDPFDLQETSAATHQPDFARAPALRGDEHAVRLCRYSRFSIGQEHPIRDEAAKPIRFGQSAEHDGVFALYLIMREQLLRAPIHPDLSIKEINPSPLGKLLRLNPAEECCLV